MAAAPTLVFMDNTINDNSPNNSFNRSWNILNWNIRGINSEDKCNAVKEKIDESACATYCIQETKRDHFDNTFIKKLAPKHFNKFASLPLLEILEALLWDGIALSLMEISLRVTNSPSQSSSLPYIMVITGFLPLFMDPVKALIGMILFSGLITFKLMILSIG